MRNPFKTRTILLGSTFLTLALGAAPAAATHAWDGLHWARTTTLNIRFADDVSSLWDPYLPVAAVDWTKAVPLDAAIVPGYKNPYSCSATYGRVEVCSYRYGYNGWLGIAQVYTSSGHIIAARVGLNDTYFAYASYNSPAWRQFVVCQEVGHTFGLDHQDETKTNANLGSCMDYTSDPSGTKGTNGTLGNLRPNAHDYDQLKLIYGHNDGWQLSSTQPISTAALGAAEQLVRRGIPNEFGMPSFDRREWGRIVAIDRKGRGRVFSSRPSAGVELTTFVLWTDAEDR